MKDLDGQTYRNRKQWCPWDMCVTTGVVVDVEGQRVWVSLWVVTTPSRRLPLSQAAYAQAPTEMGSNEELKSAGKVQFDTKNTACLGQVIRPHQLF